MTVGQISVRALFNNTTLKSLSVPLVLPTSPHQLTGARLLSVELDYKVWNGAVDNLTPLVHRTVIGVDGSPVSMTSLAFTADANHDTAAERGSIKNHRMVLTLDSPPWIDDGEFASLYVSFNSRNPSTVEITGAFANFIWRD